MPYCVVTAVAFFFMTHPFGGSGFRNQTTGLAVQEKERGEGVGGEEGGWYPVDRGRSEQRIQLIRVDDLWP